MSVLSLLQPHTIKIYNLENKSYFKETINARELLSVKRFDIFAKLYYARNRVSDRHNALKVYTSHIKAFNPDCKEPGRDDKTSLENFISAFDELLDTFENGEFDSSKSLVPVDSNGIILDGAHRVAALAFYNKEVTILRFKDVKAKCNFDFNYFINRGLAWEICDTIASEMLLWKENLLVACLWPRMGKEKEKEKAVKYLKSKYTLCYIKNIRGHLKEYEKLISLVYDAQPWSKSRNSLLDKTINCLGNISHITKFVLFESELPLEETLRIKDDLRELFKCGKHSVHITDNVFETRSLMKYVITKEGQKQWGANSMSNTISSFFQEKFLYFRKVVWINFKVFVAKLIGR